MAVPNFRLHFAGQAVSLIAAWMHVVAQSWLVLQLTGSGTMPGLVAAAQFLPVLLPGAYVRLTADLMMALVGVLAYEFQVGPAQLARVGMHGSAGTYGFLTAAVGAGAVAGGLIVAGLGRTGVLPFTVRAAGFGAAVLAAALVPSLPGELGALAVVGAFSTAFMATGQVREHGDLCLLIVLPGRACRARAAGTAPEDHDPARQRHHSFVRLPLPARVA